MRIHIILLLWLLSSGCSRDESEHQPTETEPKKIDATIDDGKESEPSGGKKDVLVPYEDVLAMQTRERVFALGSSISSLESMMTAYRHRDWEWFERSAEELLVRYRKKCVDYNDGSTPEIEGMSGSNLKRLDALSAKFEEAKLNPTIEPKLDLEERVPQQRIVLPESKR